MATTIVRDARDIYKLDCSLCTTTFKLPKVLPCLHTFCQKCLEDYIGENDRSFVCPTCQIDIPMPTKGVIGFHGNTFINNMLNILSAPHSTNCTNCGDDHDNDDDDDDDGDQKATSRCLDCVENLCAKCVTAHARIRHTKGHKILSFEELENNLLHDVIQCPSFCKEHEREILKYFCETCDDAICRECAIYEHREHDYQDLKEAVKTHRTTINTLLDHSNRKIPVVRTALNEIKQVQHGLAERKQAVATHINETINIYQRKLEEKRESLVNNLQLIFIEKDAVLKEQQVGLEIDLNNLLTSSEFVENLLQHGNEAEIMSSKRLMVKRLEYINACQQQLEPEENDVIEFIQEDKELEGAINNFGSLNSTETFPPFCYLDESSIKKAQLSHSTTYKLITLDRLKRFVFKGGDNILAKLTDPMGIITKLPVTDNQNGTYDITFTVNTKETHSLSIFIRDKPIHDSPFVIEVSSGVDVNKIGPLLTQFGSGGILKMIYDDQYEPWGIAYDGKDKVYVTDHNNHRIQVFDVNGKLLGQFGSRGKEDGDIWYPTGIAINSENNEIFIADHGNHRIQVFQPDGSFLRKFASRGTNDGEIKGPCGIAIDQHGRLVVADRDNHRIQIFNTQGKYLLQFGSQGATDGKFNSPRHVAVTTSNEILVSDSNNFRIQKFDERGTFLCTIGEKGAQQGQFMCPSGVGTDVENNILVADYKNLTVQLFNKEGEFLKYLGNDEEKKMRRLSKPTGVCITTQGNVLVADRGTHKIHIY